MAFLLIPLVLGGGALLLSGCSSSASPDVPADSNPNPNPSGSSYVAPGPSGSALVAPPPARTSPLATLLATAPEPFAAGAAPGGAELARYPGANDEEKARNWAMNRAVERYYVELRNIYPGAAPRDALNSVLGLIQSSTVSAPLRVTYTVGNGAAQTINVDHPEIVFLRRFVVRDGAPADEIASRVTELRGLMQSASLPNLSDQQYRDLLTAARDLLREASPN
ncbi:MAG TPA: hypothetical protein VFX30_00770, partial [bacterium]|nr:hypothetical protein [bacterium]